MAGAAGAGKGRTHQDAEERGKRGLSDEREPHGSRRLLHKPLDICGCAWKVRSRRKPMKRSKNSATVTISPASLTDAEAILALQKLAYESEARFYDDRSLPPLIQDIASLREEFGESLVLKATVLQIASLARCGPGSRTGRPSSGG